MIRVLGLLLLVACGEQQPAGIEGVWTLRVDRAWTAPDGVTSPSQALDEADFHVVTGPDYAVVITATAVEVGEVPMEGIRGEDVGVRAHFDLDGGTFAGGRFEVWDDGGLQAELTLFGSGVPIASSERGPLIAP
jgi:hypothetical protein